MPLNCIIGIDPGLHKTGYGIIKDGDIIASGEIEPEAIDFKERIVYVVNELLEITKEMNISVAGIETQFYLHFTRRSIMRLLQLKGALIYAFYAKGIKVIELTPREIKKAITGNGNASKAQVQYMIYQIFKKKVNEDEADAIAVAISVMHRIKNV